MPNNNQRGRNNNNPEGRNQFSNSWFDSARERPVAAAAAAAAAVGAGVFLWSRRSQISEQLSNISDQIGEWNESRGSSGSSSELETVGGGSNFSASAGSGPIGSSRGSTGMSETGGGNASLGAQTGGGGLGSTSGKTGRGRA